MELEKVPEAENCLVGAFYIPGGKGANRPLPRQVGGRVTFAVGSEMIPMEEFYWTI